jgi:hypothetical protein
MLLFTFQELFAQQIEFVSEEIELLVGDSTCTVNGLYWFKNKTGQAANVVLFYPFVVSKQLPYPDSILVADVGSEQQVKFTKKKDGIYFHVMVQAFNTALYHVSYIQRTFACVMHYLLRTTARWKKPLEQAVYRVRIPRHSVLTSSTIRFPQKYLKNDLQVFETCEEHFMPSTDFIIRWERGFP